MWCVSRRLCGGWWPMWLLCHPSPFWTWIWNLDCFGFRLGLRGPDLGLGLIQFRVQHVSGSPPACWCRPRAGWTCWGPCCGDTRAPPAADTCCARRPSETPELYEVDNNTSVCKHHRNAHLVPLYEGDQTLGSVGQPGYVLIQLTVAHAVTSDDGLTQTPCRNITEGKFSLPCHYHRCLCPLSSIPEYEGSNLCDCSSHQHRPSL